MNHGSALRFRAFGPNTEGCIETNDLLSVLTECFLSVNSALHVSE